ncbi:hypothetical protein EMIHUDRAFT_211558 [Emiliania huxleyi CCMP1516]|uniref:DNA polymerase eta n=2 Tax=Emiliania huxleyi TaxID=2903 RepID=A0A0D3IVU6_EMIH1|nr:hypothetical protein EMIHUDRAFT_211558 [Emiliania huxleyi CCMP1516]EOD15381.1 hypothetical protein EMIHUDRAFT_211558 [Emiliania huxleyi CCMP1516]|eukprot:XP_005767810.1 hypothetical protein EMIHUDRAFT_211558 [Emiliania huxleyi CCMP1516]
MSGGAQPRSSDSCRRAILHLDADCFYAQVEARRLKLPEGAPCAVQQWGGLLAVSYSARPFGVKRGMKVAEALALCPGLHIPHVATIGGGESGDAASPDRATTKVSLDRYREESRKIVDALEQQLEADASAAGCAAATLERASIDEVYVDVTALAAEELESRPPDSTGAAGDAAEGEWRCDAVDPWDQLLVGAAAVCSRLRDAVWQRAGYRLSAGIAHTKLVAKLASARRKPNQQTVVPRAAVHLLLGEAPLRSARGLGGKLGEEVAAALPCVGSIAGLAAVGEEELCRLFGRESGRWLYEVGAGELDEAVRACSAPKSLNALKSFRPTSEHAEVGRWLRLLAEELLERVAEDSARHRRTPRTLKLHWRGSLDAGHLRNWTAGRVGELTRVASRQCPFPPQGRRGPEQVVDAALRLLLPQGCQTAPLPTLTRLGLSCGDFAPIAARSIASMLQEGGREPGVPQL